ncbi:MAG TPA: hypothetical protein VFK39_08425 [Gemmatimonadaceae bacterium]|jgi:hypothetical protein|nr:hypothetical protein [Gemmatimonadaceae bacterium]
MNRLSTLRGAAAALALVAAMTACKKNEGGNAADSATMGAAPAAAPAANASVSNIDIGKGVTADNKIANSTTNFGVRDTIYASVTTENAAPGSTLSAKWTFQDGQVVDSTSQAVAPAGASGGNSVTEFHISKASPWPAGDYKVEFFLDGASVGSKDFKVGK